VLDASGFGRTLPRLLRELPAGWHRHQVGDGEANLLVPVADLDRACQVVRAYRRRKLTPEQRAALSERFIRPVAGHLRRQDASGCPREGTDSPATAPAPESPLVA